MTVQCTTQKCFHLLLSGGFESFSFNLDTGYIRTQLIKKTVSKCRWPQKVRVKLFDTSDIRESFQNGMICVKSNSSMCLQIQMFINYDKKNNITAYLAYKKPSEYSSSTEQFVSQDEWSLLVPPIPPYPVSVQFLW